MLFRRGRTTKNGFVVFLSIGYFAVVNVVQIKEIYVFDLPGLLTMPKRMKRVRLRVALNRLD